MSLPPTNKKVPILPLTIWQAWLHCSAVKKLFRFPLHPPKMNCLHVSCEASKNHLLKYPSQGPGSLSCIQTTEKWTKYYQSLQMKWILILAKKVKKLTINISWFCSWYLQSRLTVFLLSTCSYQQKRCVGVSHYSANRETCRDIRFTRENNRIGKIWI